MLHSMRLGIDENRAHRPRRLSANANLDAMAQLMRRKGQEKIRIVEVSECGVIPEGIDYTVQIRRKTQTGDRQPVVGGLRITSSSDLPNCIADRGADIGLVDGFR